MLGAVDGRQGPTTHARLRRLDGATRWQGTRASSWWNGDFPRPTLATADRRPPTADRRPPDRGRRSIDYPV